MSAVLKRKRVRVGLGLLIMLALAAGAVAYFTTTGSGTGSATAGTSSPLTITATVTPGTGGIVPGGNPASVAFSVNNPSPGNQYVGSVSLNNVKAYTDSTMSTPVPGCDTSAFSMTPVVENQDVGSGTSSLSHNGSLAFADNNTNQDACKGVYLVASFSSN